MRNHLGDFRLQLLGRVWLIVLMLLSLLSMALLDTAAVQAKPDPGDNASGSSEPPLKRNLLYFEETGHYLGGEFLEHWRTEGAYMEFGPPISEEFVDPLLGKTVQYFKKARFELVSLPRERGWRVDLGAINRERLDSLAPISDAHEEALKPLAKATGTWNSKFFKETGHSLSGAFFDRWTDMNGIGNSRYVTQTEETYLPLLRYGLPISEPYSLTVGSLTYKAQDFERSRMLQLSDGSVLLDDTIGAQTPNFKIAPVGRVFNTFKAPIYNRKSMPRWVDVNLTTQTAIFYEGNLPARRSLITSGAGRYASPIGTFAISRRVPNERMKNGKPGDPDYYDLKNVLYTQYFTDEGHALHYAWWRDTFGYPDSHGCINEDIQTSRYAWDFLNIGDKVIIRY